MQNAATQTRAATDAVKFIKAFLAVGLLGATLAAAFFVGRWQQHRADLPAMTATAKASEAADTVAAAEFRGRHSGDTLTLDAVQRVSNAYVFAYKIGDAEYRETLTGGLWQTSVKVYTDEAKTKSQWVPVEVIQALQQQTRVQAAP